MIPLKSYCKHGTQEKKRIHKDKDGNVIELDKKTQVSHCYCTHYDEFFLQYCALQDG